MLSRELTWSVSSGCRTALCKEPPEKNVVLLHTGSKGMTVGLATITLDVKGALSVGERRDVPTGKFSSRRRGDLGARCNVQKGAGNQETGKSKTGTDRGAATNSAGIHGAVPERTSRKESCSRSRTVGRATVYMPSCIVKKQQHAEEPMNECYWGGDMLPDVDLLTGCAVNFLFPYSFQSTVDSSYRHSDRIGPGWSQSRYPKMYRRRSCGT